MTSSRPKTSCLINNHNYGRFVAEAVSSALAQTVPFDEIVVVDDGSKDDSLARLHAAFGDNPRVKIVAKPNGGQMSALNRGFLESTGDILFFLDADDLYEPSMLEAVLDAYAKKPNRGMVFLPVCLFGEATGADCVWSDTTHTRCSQLPGLPTHGIPWDACGKDLDYGGGRADALVRKWAVYAPTSAISLRRGVAARFLPVDCEKEWRICADFCLVLGAALANVPRHYLHRPLIRYRVHSDNLFFGRTESPERQKAKKSAMDTVLNEIAARMDFPIQGEGAASIVVDGYVRSIPLGKRFRSGWRALGRLSLPCSSLWKWRLKYAWRALSRR